MKKDLSVKGVKELCIHLSGLSSFDIRLLLCPLFCRLFFIYISLCQTITAKTMNTIILYHCRLVASPKCVGIINKTIFFSCSYFDRLLTKALSIVDLTFSASRGVSSLLFLRFSNVFLVNEDFLLFQYLDIKI